jgi:hypothetical protein
MPPPDLQTSSRQDFKLTFPKGLDAKQVEGWLSSISGYWGGGAEGVPSCALELWASDYGLSYRLRVPRPLVGNVVHGLQAMARGTYAVPDDAQPRHQWTYIVELGEQRYGLPHNVWSVEGVAASILSSVQHLERGERALIQIVFTPAGQLKIPKYQPPLHTSSLFMGMVLSQLGDNKDEIDAKATKLKQPNFRATIRVASVAPTDARAWQIVSTIETAFRGPQNLARRGYEHRPGPGAVLFGHLVHAASPPTMPAQLSRTELAAYSAFPMGNPNVIGLQLSPTVQLPVSPVVAREGIVLADSNIPGRPRPVALTLRGTTMSTYASAPPGGGKSVFLANGFAQVVDAPYNCGAMVLETSGKPDDLLHRCIGYVPERRVEAGDVAVIDVADPTHAVGINLFEQGDPQATSTNLQALFDAMYGNTGVVTVPEALYHGVMALMTTTAAPQKMAFTDLSLLFEPTNDHEYQLGRRLTEAVPDRRIRSWWRAVYDDNPTPAKLRGAFRVMGRRIWQLNSRPEVRAVFGQSRSTLDFYEAIRGRKIILVNLAGLGDTVKNIVGAILIDLMWSAIKRGAASADCPFHCFIDEFQNYPNLARDAGTMLSEGRGFGLSMWLANQGMHQLAPSLQETIRVNIRNRFVMQTDRRNAMIFASDFGQAVTEEDILTLGAHEAIGRVVGEDPHSGHMIVSPPFTAKLRPARPASGLAQRVRAVSRAKYARPIEDVEKEIDERWRIEPDEERPRRAPLGRRDKS